MVLGLVVVGMGKVEVLQRGVVEGARQLTPRPCPLAVALD